uniref:Uncharacterized protein n=1 Tax=Pseudomonas aeruginosa TaxID=287 RepID=Q1W4V6_PSEAI|nr:hypothetical protein EXB30 [Pseudomonas aeruginosa]
MPSSQRTRKRECQLHQTRLSIDADMRPHVEEILCAYRLLTGNRKISSDSWQKRVGVAVLFQHRSDGLC